MKKAPELLADWLEAEGRKQRWLAAEVNCAERTLRSWLKGRATPVFVYRKALERVTKLPIEDAGMWK